jgi:glyoxylase-like metal-dependent hydrolase (beta-lactamase superfamily II)
VKARLKLGDFEIYWLSGGLFMMDGGAIFGVVPKLLWKDKYPCDEENFVKIAAWPLLIKTPDRNILIETGIGNKLTDKQKRNFRVSEEWWLLDDLSDLGLGREDIDIVILTHYDFDHAGGVVIQENDGSLSVTFPRARHIIQQSEWEDVLNPNMRSKNTFWPVNNELMRGSDLLELIDGDMEPVDGIKLIRTGGHNRGHQIVRLESGGQVAWHLGDLMILHAHFKALWISAYDNYPLTSIEEKDRYMKEALSENAWFLFYHDPYIPACRFDEDGKVLEKVAVRSWTGGIPENPDTPAAD